MITKGQALNLDSDSSDEDDEYQDCADPEDAAIFHRKVNGSTRSPKSKLSKTASAELRDSRLGKTSTQVTPTSRNAPSHSPRRGIQPASQQKLPKQQKQRTQGQRSSGIAAPGDSTSSSSSRRNITPQYTAADQTGQREWLLERSPSGVKRAPARQSEPRHTSPQVFDRGAARGPHGMDGDESIQLGSSFAFHVSHYELARPHHIQQHGKLLNNLHPFYKSDTLRETSSRNSAAPIQASVRGPAPTFAPPNSKNGTFKVLLTEVHNPYKRPQTAKSTAQKTKGNKSSSSTSSSKSNHETLSNGDSVSSKASRYQSEGNATDASSTPTSFTTAQTKSVDSSPQKRDAAPGPAGVPVAAAADAPSNSVSGSLNGGTLLFQAFNPATMPPLTLNHNRRTHVKTIEELEEETKWSGTTPDLPRPGWDKYVNFWALPDEPWGGMVDDNLETEAAFRPRSPLPMVPASATAGSNTSGDSDYVDADGVDDMADVSGIGPLDEESDREPIVPPMNTAGTLETSRGRLFREYHGEYHDTMPRLDEDSGTSSPIRSESINSSMPSSPEAILPDLIEKLQEEDEAEEDEYDEREENEKKGKKEGMPARVVEKESPSKEHDLIAKMTNDAEVPAEAPVLEKDHTPKRTQSAEISRDEDKDKESGDRTPKASQSDDSRGKTDNPSNLDTPRPPKAEASKVASHEAAEPVGEIIIERLPSSRTVESYAALVKEIGAAKAYEEAIRLKEELRFFDEVDTDADQEESSEGEVTGVATTVFDHFADDEDGLALKKVEEYDSWDEEQNLIEAENEKEDEKDGEGREDESGKKEEAAVGVGARIISGERKETVAVEKSDSNVEKSTPEIETEKGSIPQIAETNPLSSSTPLTATEPNPIQQLQRSSTPKYHPRLDKLRLLLDSTQVRIKCAGTEVSLGSCRVYSLLGNRALESVVWGDGLRSGSRDGSIGPVYQKPSQVPLSQEGAKRVGGTWILPDLTQNFNVLDSSTAKKNIMVDDRYWKTCIAQSKDIDYRRWRQALSCGCFWTLSQHCAKRADEGLVNLMLVVREGTVEAGAANEDAATPTTNRSANSDANARASAAIGVEEAMIWNLFHGLTEKEDDEDGSSGHSSQSEGEGADGNDSRRLHGFDGYAVTPCFWTGTFSVPTMTDTGMSMTSEVVEATPVARMLHMYMLPVEPDAAYALVGRMVTDPAEDRRKGGRRSRGAEGGDLDQHVEVGKEVCGVNGVGAFLVMVGIGHLKFSGEPAGRNMN
ncbi:hypothetical protein HK102_013776 [Quaeritorhiza haematococci]|nr:hypothetical protein HK102_013776 [Quaeritorhiza haematococci]